MPAAKGRDLLIEIGTGTSPDVFTPLGGLRTRTITINNEPVDITNDDTAPQRELLTGAGLKTISISGSGSFKDDAAIQRMEDLIHNATSNEQDFKIKFPSGNYIQGTFHLTTFEYTGESTGAVEYNVTLENAGAWIFDTSGR